VSELGVGAVHFGNDGQGTETTKNSQKRDPKSCDGSMAIHGDGVFACKAWVALDPIGLGSAIRACRRSGKAWQVAVRCFAHASGASVPAIGKKLSS